MLVAWGQIGEHQKKHVYVEISNLFSDFGMVIAHNE